MSFSAIIMQAGLLYSHSNLLHEVPRAAAHAPAEVAAPEVLEEQAAVRKPEQARFLRRLD